MKISKRNTIKLIVLSILVFTCFAFFFLASSNINYAKGTSFKSEDYKETYLLGEKIEVTIPGREKGFFAKLKNLFGRK